jgi:hypothetical protein
MTNDIVFTGKSISYLNKQIKRYQALGYRTVKTHKHPDGGLTVTMGK